VRFNYIITIHNKDDLIEKVLLSVLVCCRADSHIYAVLDGCTDRTEEVIDGICQYYDRVPLTKVYTDDVHEILAINAGLNAADQTGDGFNIIVQDDVILADCEIETKIEAIYEQASQKIGMLSFRHGLNLELDHHGRSVREVDVVESCYGHGVSDGPSVMPGPLVERMVAVRSPECIPCATVRKVGVMEQRLAPYTYDNHEYSLRCLQHGLRNYVFSVRIFSKVEWGGMRRRRDPQVAAIMERNRRFIYEQYGDFVAGLRRENFRGLGTVVPSVVTNFSESELLRDFQWNRRVLNAYTTGGLAHRWKGMALSVLRSGRLRMQRTLRAVGGDRWLRFLG